MEIHLQEVTANIFLTEITEGGLQAAGELQRLNENDIEFDTDFALATVSDQVLNELNLLQIFEESMTQGDLPSSRVANDEATANVLNPGASPHYLLRIRLRIHRSEHGRGENDQMGCEMW